MAYVPKYISKKLVNGRPVYKYAAMRRPARLAKNAEYSIFGGSIQRHRYVRHGKLGLGLSVRSLSLKLDPATKRVTSAEGLRDNGLLSSERFNLYGSRRPITRASSDRLLRLYGDVRRQQLPR